MTSANQAIADVQNRRDNRNLPITKVGIKDIKHPMTVSTQDGGKQHSIGLTNMYVGLAADVKGTHMSRFVELLDCNKNPYNLDNFKQLLQEMLQKLNATEGSIETRFTFFTKKVAPISQVTSMLDYDVRFIGEIGQFHQQIDIEVIVPITSLCPCSKEISDYGAHNQRSHVTARLRLAEPVSIEEVIQRIEKHASCELYGLLKRSDEKYVTERAYDNPKFVEDLVRDIATEFNQDPRIVGYSIASENFESIHNHSAYALIDKLA